MRSLLTVVIPTYNEEAYIIRTLDEVRSQLGCSTIRIIIADASSTDKTRDLINEKYPEIEIVEGGLPSKGRNAGAKLVKTKYTLFLDADVTFSCKNAIRLALKKMIRRNKEMVSTNPIYMGEPDFRAWLMFKINGLTTKLMSTFSPFAIGAFVMIETKKFKELGGYNEYIKQSEDWLLSRQIKPNKFGLLMGLITQDNRRFKRYGYFNMIKLMASNFVNMNNVEHFKDSHDYWK